MFVKVLIQYPGYGDLIVRSVLQDEVAHEAETGKVYCANYNDRHGRTVLVMRPCRQVSFALCSSKTPNRNLLDIFSIPKFLLLVAILEISAGSGVGERWGTKIVCHIDPYL